MYEKNTVNPTLQAVKKDAERKLSDFCNIKEFEI